MDQILFIIFGHSVDNQIDAQVEGVFALFLAAWRARVRPVAELVALPGATEIILTVDDRRGIADGNSFQVRIGDSYAADAPEQVITPQRRVAGGQAFELIAREYSLHFSPQRLVEAIALLAESIIDEQKAAVGEKAAQDLDLVLSEGIELVFAGDVKKRIIEKIAVRNGNFVSGRGGFDTRAQHQLVHQRGDCQWVRVPVAAAILELREDKLDGALVFGARLGVSWR